MCILKICALYKIYRGKEFLIESLQSIYNHVDKLVFVSSDTGWDDSHDNNTVELLEAWQGINDIFKKIVIIKTSTNSQDRQYQIGMEYIRSIGADWILLIDSDEVWDAPSWEKAQDQLWDASPEVNGFYASMHTYIKSPFYRVIGDRQVKPMVFVRPTIARFGIRGNGTTPSRYMTDVFVHHFALVRDSIEEVFWKMRTSIVGDKHAFPLVDLDKWKTDVWDKIPGPASHYFVGCDGVWEKTVEISKEELPITVLKTLMETKIEEIKNDV
jgi:glycosyltransferase involved in cell wall biosynthesis